MLFFHSIVTRFSVPDLGGLKGSSLSLRERVAWLYDDNRLEIRFELFERFVLPAIARAAKGRLVRHSILYSEKMPDKWLKRLFEVSHKYSFVNLVLVPPPVFGQVLRQTRWRECRA